MSDHTKSYKERNASGYNKAEDLFERYCQGRGVEYRKMGFDEKGGYIKGFFAIPQLMRSLPDYIISQDEKIYFVHVKGTNKLKISDLINYGAFSRLYCSFDVQLYMAFCFERDGKTEVNLVSWSKIEKQMILGSEIKKFDSDGKLYLEVNL